MAALRLALLGVPLMSCVGRPPPVPATVGAAVSGIYRNMFVEAGYAPSAVDAKIAAAFSQLYINGDPSTQRIYFEQPGNATAYVSDMKNNDVRTEGMGYGLMVMLQLGDQPRFDRIWAWVKRFMYHGDWNDPLYGWSAWHCYHNGTVIDEGPAPDGFVTSLLFASRRWGDSSGRFNYSSEANTILTFVNSKAEPANMFDKASLVVRFDPSCGFTDPSYFLSAFYPVWALRSNYSGVNWNASAAATRAALFSAANRPTGLAPHTSAFDGSPGGFDGTFEDDAWRVARNWGLDYSWWAADDRALQLSSAIMHFFDEQGQGRYADRYDLNGTVLTPFWSPGLAAATAIAALASNDSIAWRFIDALWEMPIPSGDDPNSDRYFSGSLYLEALLILSGQYRAWL